MFEDALAALAGLLGEDDAGGERVTREVRAGAGDPGALLVAWMEELVHLAESERLVPEHLTRLALGDGRLAATVVARRGAPPHLVKGVTYHGLSFDEGPHGCRATVVLDV